MPELKFIYFDVGGVLIDWKNAFKTVTDKFQIPFNKFIIEWNIYDDRITRGLITPQEFWNLVRKDLNITEGNDFNFLENWIADYKSVRETNDLIINLKKNFKVGILSNIYKGMLNQLIKKKYVPDILYDAIIDSSEVGLRKPERNIYLLAQEKARVNNKEILLVDDRKVFVDEASKIGWQGYLFNHNNINKSVKDIKNILGF